MKRMIAVMLAAVMAFSTCACGTDKNDQTPPADNTETEGASEENADQEKEQAELAGEETASSEGTAASAEDDLEKDKEELSAIGDVQVENGLLTVSVTVPASLMGEVTQEELDEGKGDKYLSATLNEDGSVTYKMTKAQHKAMLESMTEEFDKAIQKLVDDDNYSIASVTHNADFTSFDVTLDGTELGMVDMFTAYAFYIYGGLYGTFNGNSTEHIIVNFYDPDGNLIDSADSADMGSEESAE